MPFLIDSVVAPTAARLRKGDEIVAMESRRTADRRKDGGYLQLHAGDTTGRRRNWNFPFPSPPRERSA